MKKFALPLATFALLVFAACDNGGKPNVTPASVRTCQVDATSYLAWVYIDLSTGQTTTVVEYGDEPSGTAPENWHFALHRYNCKTNGALALETSYGNIDDIKAIPEGEFVADVWTDDVVIYDLSGMAEGVIKYAESYYNAEMSKWMDVNMGSMPPIYTPSDKVYVLKFTDGTKAAVRFTDFVGPKEVKWHITFDYLYPLQF